jgi:hypothetical protein
VGGERCAKQRLERRRGIWNRAIHVDSHVDCTGAVLDFANGTSVEVGVVKKENAPSSVFGVETDIESHCVP